ncbi:MAG: hypothetical protein ACON4H_00435 [Rubripirellula sp.]
MIRDLATRNLCWLIVILSINHANAEAPPFTDYCERLSQEIQGKKHGFLAGNVTYYVGGFHASWNLQEHETLGLTHPFFHDLRGRGVGITRSNGHGASDTGTGNDFGGWEFYKDTRVLYGTVLVDGKEYQHPVPKKMIWRPDRLICEYQVEGVTIKEEKFIGLNDAACTFITASQPVKLQFKGQSFFGRHSVSSTASIRYVQSENAIHVIEGGTTKCKPDTDRLERVAPIMYDGMSTVLKVSQNISSTCRFSTGEKGQQIYEFVVNCDEEGVAIVWAMNDQYDVAITAANEIGGQVTLPSTGRNSGAPYTFGVASNVRESMFEKTSAVNLELNQQIPWFRCSEQKHEAIYYYLWSLYLMYYINVGDGWEKEPHTQTAVNNFLGIHRYDSTFQIRVGAWLQNKRHYAYGNVLTWKHLFTSGHFLKDDNGVIALADNKGRTWHSGVYGNELSEHVLGAWQIYQHTGDLEFLRDCYEGYFREVFYDQIVPFASNHFVVAEILLRMAKLLGHSKDVLHWKKIVQRNEQQMDSWFEQRWEVHGHSRYFGGPRDGMLMTNGFWHFRSPYFPREYALEMTAAWALNRTAGFYGDFFPLAMSRKSMAEFASSVDHSFGYTPDTAYFTLSGMFEQRMGVIAQDLAMNHLSNYNFDDDWNIPVAPEAYTRSGSKFGDQYSNFNAGKILLYLEGFAGISYSIPRQRLWLRENLPADWQWMHVKIPVNLGVDQETVWVDLQYSREFKGEKTTKQICVENCPLLLTVEPCDEGKHVSDVLVFPEADGAARGGNSESTRVEFYESHQRAMVTMVLEDIGGQE